MSLSLVSGQDGFAPEWSTQAIGPSKRSLAESLSISLWKRLGRGGRTSARTRGVVRRRVSPALAARLLLPRRRRARVEKSRAPELWACAAHPASRSCRSADLADQAQRLAQSIARGLGVDPARVVAAHEDPLHELWRARAPRPRPAGGSPRSSAPARPRRASVERAPHADRLRLAALLGSQPAPAGSAAPGVSVAAGSISRRAALPWATACRSTA